MKKILVLQGPNLNLLGFRETAIYGSTQLETIHAGLVKQAEAQNYHVSCMQSNHEGVLIDAIHQALADKTDFIIFNPGAFTHTSIALRDALLAVAIPFIEVHISNIYQREPFRQKSYFSDLAQGVISGLGVSGYYFALEAAMQRFNHHD